MDRKTFFSSNITKFALDYLKIFLAVYIVTHVFFQQYEVEGASMTPNLHTADRVWIDRVSYLVRKPVRGEVVVLKYPNDLSLNFVKRVIGLPGEQVKIADGKVTIINSEHPQGFVLDESYVSSGNVTLVRGVETETFTVPENEYFVLGDNRGGSSDSREWGFLPFEDIRGRAVFRTYPLSQINFIGTAKY